MEDLTSLMSIIDDISKAFPEGKYLEACTHMKNIYKRLPRATSPDVNLVRIQTPRPLFDSDSDSENDENYRIVVRGDARERQELSEIGSLIYRCERGIRQIESRLRYLKVKQRITQSVKKDAVRERAQQLGYRLREYNIEELRARGHQIPDERSFYRSYLERYNSATRNLIDNLKDDLNNINQERRRHLDRRDELQTLFFGAPLQ